MFFFLFAVNNVGKQDLKLTSNGKLQYKNQIKPCVSIMITTSGHTQILINYNVTRTNNLHAA